MKLVINKKIYDISSILPVYESKQEDLSKKNVVRTKLNLIIINTTKYKHGRRYEIQIK